MNNEAAQTDYYVTMSTEGHTEVVAIATRVFIRYPGLLWSDEHRSAVALWARGSDDSLVTMLVGEWQAVLGALQQIHFTEAQGGVTGDELTKVEALAGSICAACI
jgi:hypothetical protein